MSYFICWPWHFFYGAIVNVNVKQQFHVQHIYLNEIGHTFDIRCQMYRTMRAGESRWSSGNTLASDANYGPGSISPGRGTLEDDSSFHPFGVGKLSTSFMLGVKSLFTAIG